ncbi:MAG: pre-16S rRNA-processing nuclease YqgF [Armatimonadetes bacterium]|nr:pre-16S rRNA-processing nuclease YqgF [Armatimonadota bacterium]
MAEQAQECKPFLAIDPGTGKCGVALLSPEGEAIKRTVAAVEELAKLVSEWGGRELTVVLGMGTGYQRAAAALKEAGVEHIELVEEARTSLQARQLYWEAHPPRGWRRLIPRGLLVPPVPVDDWAAVALGRAWLAQNRLQSS